MTDAADTPENEDDENAPTPGWDAIDAALTALYPDQEPVHFGTALPMSLGGDDPLNGISVYKNLVPVPHFHFITYGFSELFDKEFDEPEISGFGFELTFRLACAADDTDPPDWVIDFLQNLARYIFSTGNPLGQNHYVDLRGPISLDHKTEITCVAVAADPQLGEFNSPNGRAEFLQLVGICSDEYELVQDWDCSRMLQELAKVTP
ncbi:MAG: suppressor of fused domain protein, partial [Planctomycetes bacterium]|nr:suppressor of fused domain protein [Planctomycetota bacterium]